MGILFFNHPSRCDPIGCWHADIHHHNVWLKPLHGGNGFFAIGCLANQFQILVACEDLFENPADQGFIIYD